MWSTAFSNGFIQNSIRSAVHNTAYGMALVNIYGIQRMRSSLKLAFQTEMYDNDGRWYAYYVSNLHKK